MNELITYIGYGVGMGWILIWLGALACWVLRVD
jgi:hypothetical protein